MVASVGQVLSCVDAPEIARVLIEAFRQEKLLPCIRSLEAVSEPLTLMKSADRCPIRTSRCSRALRFGLGRSRSDLSCHYLINRHRTWLRRSSLKDSEPVFLPGRCRS